MRYNIVLFIILFRIFSQVWFLQFNQIYSLFKVQSIHFHKLQSNIIKLHHSKKMFLKIISIWSEILKISHFQNKKIKMSLTILMIKVSRKLLTNTQNKLTHTNTNSLTQIYIYKYNLGIIIWSEICVVYDFSLFIKNQ